MSTFRENIFIYDSYYSPQVVYFGKEFELSEIKIKKETVDRLLILLYHLTLVQSWPWLP